GRAARRLLGARRPLHAVCGPLFRGLGDDAPHRQPVGAAALRTLAADPQQAGRRPAGRARHHPRGPGRKPPAVTAALPAGLLLEIQRRLEALYALDHDAPVTDFLLPEDEASAYPGG